MRRRVLIITTLLMLPALSFAGGNKEDGSADQADSAQAAAESSQSDSPGTSGTILDTTDPEKYVALVNGVGILRSDYELAVQRTQEAYLFQGTPIPESDLLLLHEELLNQLVSEELLAQEGLSQGIQADAQAGELQYQQMRAQFATDAAWQTALLENDTDEDELRLQIDRNIVIQQVIAGTLAEVEPVSMAERQAFYDENPSFFQTGEQVAARHILISTEGLTTEEEKAEARGRAEAIRAELLEGKEFGAMAQEKSEGPSGPAGGDLGTFGRGQMVAPFEEAAFSLEPGTISEVVETQFGYHIIQVTGKIDGDITPLEDVAISIDQYLIQEKQALLLETYVEKLRAVASIVVNK
ncbi:MAG: peptidylprolyl isomerase [Spirochaetia bacterium]